MNYYGEVSQRYEQMRVKLVDAVRKELEIDRAPKVRRWYRRVRSSAHNKYLRMRYKLKARRQLRNRPPR